MKVVLKRKQFGGILHVLGNSAKLGFPNFSKAARAAKAGELKTAATQAAKGAGALGAGTVLYGGTAAGIVGGIAANRAKDTLEGDMGGKSFSEPGDSIGPVTGDMQSQKKGGLGSTLAKVGAGVGTIGLGVLGAKKGMFGTGAMTAVNKGWVRAGNAFGSQGMVKSGFTGIKKAAQKDAMAAGNFTKREAVKYGQDAMKEVSDKYNIAIPKPQAKKS